MPFFPSASIAASSASVKVLFLARALQLHEIAVLGHHEIHVHLRRDILHVTKIE